MKSREKKDLSERKGERKLPQSERTQIKSAFFESLLEAAPPAAEDDACSTYFKISHCAF
jgi:hypothetical protein